MKRSSGAPGAPRVRVTLVHPLPALVATAVLTTIALGILLRGVIVLVWGAQEQHPLHVLGWQNVALPVGPRAKISVVGLTLVLTTAAVYLGLWVFLRRTRWGIRMRAVGQNPLLAAQRGIGLHGIYALAWSLATFTGGLVGMLIASDSALDQGMVVKFKDIIYYGPDAIRVLTLLSSGSGLFNRVAYGFFGTPTRAGIFYPLGKALRNLVLKLLGIRYIDNLKLSAQTLTKPN